MALCLALLRLGGVAFTIPWSAIRPANLGVFLLLSVLGIFFWNCVFAAIAVTINDPNSSTRSSLGTFCSSRRNPVAVSPTWGCTLVNRNSSTARTAA